jgi:hypothetical protein
MIRALRLLALMSVGAIASLGAASCGDTEQVVASVGTQRIEHGELEHWIAVEQTADPGPKQPQASEDSRALSLLISWAWTLEEAHERGIRVTGEEALRQRELSQSDLDKGITYEWFEGEHALLGLLSSSKVSKADQLRLVRMGMLAARVARRRVELAGPAVSAARIAEYYQRHKDRYVSGERRDVKAVMNLSRARTLEAKRELEAGRSFSSVVARFNQTSEGGLRLNIAPGRKQYKKDFFAAPPHVLVGPKKEVYYYVFEVLRIKPARQRTLHEVESAIRSELAVQDAKSTLREADERRWQARTHCRAGYSSTRCGAG